MRRPQIKRSAGAVLISGGKNGVYVCNIYH